MSRHFFVSVFALLILLPTGAATQQLPDAESWQRDAAWRASEAVDTSAEKSRLQQLLKTGDDSAALRLIREIEVQENWPAPARERVIYEYVSSLRQETPHVVGTELIDYLKGFQSSVFIPHEDHPASSVPMFNIKGAAAGVVNGWSRLEAAFQGAALISENPSGLGPAYIAEYSIPRKLGLLDALDTASPGQRKIIARISLKGMEENPELIAVAARAALINSDLDMLIALAEKGHGMEMHRLFRNSADLFDTAQRQQLLQAALRNPWSETAALAIAQLAPGLAGHEPTEDLLIQILSDPELGSTAALALAIHPGPVLITRLQTLADSDDAGLAATRARLALQMHVSGLNMGTQR